MPCFHDYTAFLSFHAGQMWSQSSEQDIDILPAMLYTAFNDLCSKAMVLLSVYLNFGKCCLVTDGKLDQRQRQECQGPFVPFHKGLIFFMVNWSFTETWVLSDDKIGSLHLASYFQQWSGLMPQRHIESDSSCLYHILLQHTALCTGMCSQNKLCTFRRAY